VAVAMSITAVPVLASIIAERGAARSRTAVVAMTSAGVVDAAGWLALLIVLFLAGGPSTGGRPLPVTVGLFGGYVLVMVYGVRPGLGRWLRRPGTDPRQAVPVVVTVAMTSAWATSALGLHVI